MESLGYGPRGSGQGCSPRMDAGLRCSPLFCVNLGRAVCPPLAAVPPPQIGIEVAQTKRYNSWVKVWEDLVSVEKKLNQHRSSLLLLYHKAPNTTKVVRNIGQVRTFDV